MSSNSLVFQTSVGISSNPAAFLFLIFVYRVEFFWRKLYKFDVELINNNFRGWFMRNFRRFPE